MIHVFRLGPLSSGATPTYAYVGLVEGAEPRVHEAPSDEGGLRTLQGAALGQPLSCEPALAEAAQKLGLESAPLPPEALRVRALLAYELATGVQSGASRRDALAAFLAGAAAFWAARSWEVVGPDERVHVAFQQGQGEVDAELSVVGGDGMRHPGVALCDERGALEALAKLEGEARAEAALRLANLTVDMEREPAWAAEALDEGYGLPRVPVAGRNRGGPAPVVTQDLVVAAALLQAIAAFTGLEEEGAAGEATAEASGMRVIARVGASARLPAAPAEGLTPVAAGGAAADAGARAFEEARAAKVAEAAEARAAEVVEAEAARAAEVAAAAAQAEAKAAQAEETAKASQAHTEAAAPSTPAAPAAETPPLPAPGPAPQRTSTPAPATARAAAAPEAPSAPVSGDGWLTRALRSLRGGSAPRTPGPAAPAPRAPAPRKAPPPAARAPAPPAGPEVDDADPFAPFARALRIALPAPAPAPAPADEATLAELGGRVIEAATAATSGLVSFPAVALQIVERVHDPRADARGVAGFVARDPALAADVVSVANSAAFRGLSEIESVHDAVARLGLAEVGRVASAVAARKVLDPEGGRGDGAATALFVRAVAVATAAAGAALRQRGARTDHVWLGGLLHDVGRVLARRLFVELAHAPGAHLTPVALTDRVVERVHVQVGEAALRQWGLPAYLLDICAHHHDDAVPAERVDLHLVRLTSALASLDEPLVAARAAREIVQSAAALGLGAPAVRALATELKAAEERARALVR